MGLTGLTVLIGGARSGKSALAVRLASDAPGPVVMIATGEARDDEMADRIRRHQADRPAEWRTIEEPHDVDGALSAAAAGSVVIVDCVTLWVANLLERGETDAEIHDRARRAATLAAARRGATIVVSNEIGLGVVPVSALARRYADLLGQVNGVWVAASDRAAFVVAGRALPLSDPGYLMEDNGGR